jgi:hypothetical protein
VRYSPIVIIIASLLLLASCEHAAKVNARQKVGHSRAAYRDCLDQNPDNFHACNATRLAYEADLRAYLIASGMQP